MDGSVSGANLGHAIGDRDDVGRLIHPGHVFHKLVQEFVHGSVIGHVEVPHARPRRHRHHVLHIQVRLSAIVRMRLASRVARLAIAHVQLAHVSVLWNVEGRLKLRAITGAPMLSQTGIHHVRCSLTGSCAPAATGGDGRHVVGLPQHERRHNCLLHLLQLGEGVAYHRMRIGAAIPSGMCWVTLMGICTGATELLPQADQLAKLHCLEYTRDVCAEVQWERVVRRACQDPPSVRVLVKAELRAEEPLPGGHGGAGPHDLTTGRLAEEGNVGMAPKLFLESMHACSVPRHLQHLRL
mmetsp:Transcript_123406/g.343740  ORF Transcript_123406/g.343740 Transcript_123406/m.343740 type:complete len:296 (+) Transcript_123406:903-1790(+)